MIEKFRIIPLHHNNDKNEKKNVLYKDIPDDVKAILYQNLLRNVVSKKRMFRKKPILVKNIGLENKTQRKIKKIKRTSINSSNKRPRLDDDDEELYWDTLETSADEQFEFPSNTHTANVKTFERSKKNDEKSSEEYVDEEEEEQEDDEEEEKESSDDYDADVLDEKTDSTPINEYMNTRSRTSARTHGHHPNDSDYAAWTKWKNNKKCWFIQHCFIPLNTHFSFIIFLNLIN